MKKLLLTTAVAALAPMAAHAAVVQLQGDFILTAVGDNGTLGAGGNTQPGLQLDPDGTGTFDPNVDFISPGVPFEAFVFQSDQSGVIANNNNGVTFGFAETQATTDLSGTLFDNRATWAGANNFASISLDTRFNDDSRSIEIVTTITALQDLTGVYFGRQIDPDPNNVAGGSASTVNRRGLDLNMDGDFDDDGELGINNIVTASGSGVGETLALFTFESVIPVDTGIDASCCSVNAPILDIGGHDFPGGSEGDHGLGLVFDLGDLLTGDVVSFSTFYGVAAEFDDIIIDPDPDPDPDPVPAPGVLGLLGLGLAGVALRRRRR